MAQKVQVILVDDLDGGEAEESVSFSLDGVSYEIDLSAANAEALREAIAPWVEHARRISGRSGGRGRGAARGRSAAKADLGDVRSWARDNGYQVSDRGRVSAEVMAAYEGAH
ncbi:MULTISPECIES: Lsr2 family protein [Kineosporia]|uniref:Lsr2 family protein n=1 Tax=Kineosporia mesophila TaxID=566012 RepID=A0ABP6ZAE0_9ACTN|nr:MULTISPECIES: Lsr2 family protein [Kineosporia]MCD5354863.1 Lsr2 family protein [Kineosporia mesophila]GLY27564.1 Lsr2 family protein [Kineosporia sp. NBRC 101731]